MVVGILGGILTSDDPLLGLGAAVVAGVWVLALSVTPGQILRRPLVIDVLTLGGAIVAVAALTLTGGTSSFYLILSFMPTMVASAWSGLRVGVASAGLTAGLLLAVTLSREENPRNSIGLAALYLIVGATVAQIRKLLRDAEDRVSTLTESSAVSTRRLEDLEQANQLLAQLTELAAGADLSPIELGRTALDSLQSRYPDANLAAAIVGENGPIVVARSGTHNPSTHEHRVDLTIGDRQVGYVRIGVDTPLPEEEIARASIGLEPLALAFSNALLLQQLTTSAVKEERTRLARELHDEIGPTLSALGLSLDVAMFQSSERRELTDHLHGLRQQVGAIVDEVRVTVSDLRSTRIGSLRSYVTALSSQIGASVDLSQLDERRPARPSLAESVTGICGEALRNAVHHSGSTAITVKGWIDFDRGRVVIEDDGKGFDPDEVEEGHYGLIGMRERAEKAGIDLHVSSGNQGTRVVLSWGGTT